MFGQRGFAFIYKSKTVIIRKLSARSFSARLIRMDSDKRLCRVKNKVSLEVIIAWLVDLKPCKTEALPSVTNLLDGLSLQSQIE